MKRFFIFLRRHYPVQVPIYQKAEKEYVLSPLIKEDVFHLNFGHPKLNVVANV
jgi:hypothetical protein